MRETLKRKARVVCEGGRCVWYWSSLGSNCNTGLQMMTSNEYGGLAGHPPGAEFGERGPLYAGGSEIRRRKKLSSNLWQYLDEIP